MVVSGRGAGSGCGDINDDNGVGVGRSDIHQVANHMTENGSSDIDQVANHTTENASSDIDR